MQKRYLIVGLGNPGKSYEKTRHNIGFQIVKAFAKKHSITFRASLSQVKGSLGMGVFGEKKIFLLLPLTYMNQSGQSVRQCLDYYKIDDLIVITDDIALVLGRIRMRLKGSSGGHNGLKDVEAKLKTQEYKRLRVGVGDRNSGDLADYVLGRFTEEEQKQLPEIITRCVCVLETWLLEGEEVAMLRANR